MQHYVKPCNTVSAINVFLAFIIVLICVSELTLVSRINNKNLKAIYIYLHVADTFPSNLIGQLCLSGPGYNSRSV